MSVVPPRARTAHWAALVLVTLVLAPACAKQRAEAGVAPGTKLPAAAEVALQATQLSQEQKRLDADFPLHGLVTGAQLKVRQKADPDALVIGWLRIGSRVRLGREPLKTATCRSGYYALYPHGFVCAGEGVQVSESPPQSELAANPPAKDAPLPYAYYLVKEAKVPEYHRLPSREEQRTVEA